jgi:hypothetical protein
MLPVVGVDGPTSQVVIDAGGGTRYNFAYGVK